MGSIDRCCVMKQLIKIISTWLKPEACIHPTPTKTLFSSTIKLAMAISVPSPRLVLMVLAMAAVSLLPVVYGQIGTACTAANIASFSPCMNFLTNSTTNGTAPTADCCNSLKNLTSTSKDCMCLIVTGNGPFQVPINRTLAISLPRACNTPGVPLQCKATGAPLPAPGPFSLAPSSAPGASAAATPTASTAPEPTSSAESPESITPSATGVYEAPTATTGSRPVLTPSAAMPSYALSPSLLLFASAVLVLKFH
ncbi:non-specific lipid transfer protein GPI-anchored 20-like [Argentina anserina]|uniref:non-specific lipid transfer protein GPI-anchored 20-like n=1 Tax=Argentina anserina TaxID=57926 RepID=UPI0021767512|nr:non-specific lipid transfer protein GPI-anchored 20-like [Potentilla anserina]